MANADITSKSTGTISLVSNKIIAHETIIIYVSDIISIENALLITSHGIDLFSSSTFFLFFIVATT